MNSYLRMPARRSRRWTSQELAEATVRLERLGVLESDSRKILAMPQAKRPRDDRPFAGFSFRLPWAPSVNNAFYNRAQGEGRGKSKKAKVFADAAHLALIEQNVPRNYIGHPIAVHIVQHASRDSGDVDNYIKIILDCLKNSGVIHDDNRSIVKEVHIYDGTRVERGCEAVDVRVVCWLGMNAQAAHHALEKAQ